VKTIKKAVEVGDGNKVSTAWRAPDDYDRDGGVILAHGAGNDMHSEFISAMHERWSEAGILSVKFNFLYKEKRGRLPDRTDVLMDTWRAVADSVASDPDLAPRRQFHAGKSLGGRIASMLAAQGAAPAGLIFLGYPLHPAGKPERLRIAHLGRVRCPMLFIQGTRDALCDLDILTRVLADLGDDKNVLYKVEGADHSFRVLKKLKRDTSDVYHEISECALDFIAAQTKSSRK
jgi:hypothetical protein